MKKLFFQIQNYCIGDVLTRNSSLLECHTRGRTLASSVEILWSFSCWQEWMLKFLMLFILSESSIQKNSKTSLIIRLLCFLCYSSAENLFLIIWILLYFFLAIFWWHEHRVTYTCTVCIYYHWNFEALFVVAIIIKRI